MKPRPIDRKSNTTRCATAVYFQKKNSRKIAHFPRELGCPLSISYALQTTHITVKSYLSNLNAVVHTSHKRFYGTIILITIVFTKTRFQNNCAVNNKYDIYNVLPVTFPVVLE